MKLENYITKSSAEMKLMSEDQLLSLKTANEEIKAKNEAIIAGELNESKAEILELKGALTAQEEVAKIQGAELSLLKTKSVDTASKERINIESLVEGYKTKGAGKLAVKTVASSSITGSTLSFVETGVGQVATRKPFMSELFRKVSLGTNAGGVVTFIDQDTVTRGAGNVASTSALPTTSDITYVENSEGVKKIGDTLPICKDALEDFDFIQGELDDFLQTNMMLKLDSQLLLGDGSSNQFKGIDAVAQTFSVASGSPIEGLADQYANANTYDVITAAITQVENSGQNNAFQVNGILMHPNTVAILAGEKDANGNYLIHPAMSAANDISIKGIKIYSTQLVVEGTLYVGDFNKATLYTLRSLELDMTDSHGTNFTSDISVIKATLRAALVIKKNHRDAFCKVTDIDTAKAALDKA